jgi:hypothetical protein
MIEVVLIVGAALLWVAAGTYGYVSRRLKRETEAYERELAALHEDLDKRLMLLEGDERELREKLEKAERYAWSVGKRWGQPCPPGPDDPPQLYVLPGAQSHTNSCEEARRAWMNVATQGRDLIREGKADEAEKLLNVSVSPGDAARRIKVRPAVNLVAQ